MNSVFQIYGKQNCSNCNKIKKLCIENKKTFEYKELDVDFTRPDFEWFWKDIEPENRQYPILRYNGILISYHLFNQVYLEEFLS